MALSIQQETTYEGKHRWHWAVRLDGPPEELDGVEYVDYVLHPTFFDPVRRVEERQTNFRLDSYSWGAFTVYGHGQAPRRTRDGPGARPGVALPGRHPDLGIAHAKSAWREA